VASAGIRYTSFSILGQNRPCHSEQLIGQRYDHHILVSTGQPAAEAGSLPGPILQHDSCSLHEESSQIRVTPLAEREVSMPLK
jgi:hypothetical protein